MIDRRRALLTAALGFALVDADAPELALVDAWLDTGVHIGDSGLAGIAAEGVVGYTGRPEGTP